ncbi:pre-mRNA-splicing factor ATP-dependent RNA helicase prp22 [Fistulina hepatica ATCC 64428]|uniref:RNA helicase n=1 Tax=Fistulina hepatica ATCC 64428 TaxID=1128425 RepID=A0A0D7A406_9AGAR|nr:pre-mRNA-splicing factor ATP-dependent RNA helicase prp22 [Fistulina hepatica ATCC 64428]
MAKKKKQVKPNRGFATVSVPKKVVPADDPPEQPALDNAAVDADKLAQNASSNGHSDQRRSDSLSSEDAALQMLVDKYQERTEKEITRSRFDSAQQAIQVDRRFAMTFPTLDLDPALREQILALALKESVIEDKRPLDDSEDKALAKLGITYGVVRRLGFSDARVLECMSSISEVDLDGAFGWLYLHCSEDELVFNKAKCSEEVSEPHTPVRGGNPGKHNPRTPAGFLASSTFPLTKKLFKLDANAAIFVPSRLSSPVLGNNIAGDKSTNTLDSESSDEESPHEQYVRTKLKLDELSTVPKSNASALSQLPALRARLATIQKNYFFDAKEAELMYEARRKELLQAKLRGELPVEAKDPQPASPSLKEPVPMKPHPASSDVFDDNSDTGDDSGGMLELLEMPTTEVTPQGVTVQVRDMALPKNWSGRSPKHLLQDNVSKTDKYAAISFSIMSGSSRAKRASVSIRWASSRTSQWSMEDVACHDDSQAEQYIATVALHALSFPPSEGFSTSGASTTGNVTFFRSFPPQFRDLWNELEAKRKLEEDRINREIWGKLRSIIQSKMETGKVAGKIAKSIADAKESKLHRQVLAKDNGGPNEQLRLSLLARRESPLYQKMLVHRNALPIAAYRQTIVQALEESQVLVLSGETGCGKSTQLPTFLLEDQLSRGKRCKIYCTEPRRISAISLAQRVSRELGEPAGAVGTINSLVGYSIRLESNTSKNTRLAFVTYGIALRMLESGSGQDGQGMAFDDITHIIIDEVHERSIESDFLLIVLKQLLRHRPDLKVVLMSATVNAEKISEYFDGCPMLHVPGRTFPVEVKYLEDAIEYTGWSISPNSAYARRPHDKYFHGKTEWSEEQNVVDDDDDEEEQDNIKLEKRYSPSTAETINRLDDRQIPYDLIVRLLERICFEDTDKIAFSPAVLIFMPGMGEIRRLNDMLSEHPAFSSDDFIIYPLHSTLPSESQTAVFDIPPHGVRKIVIATNIAETGITIPDITTVIDTGKHREMRFDEKRQISRLVESHIAKSNAAQRRGRAGRVREGLCYHLFTKVRHDTKMAEHPLPEMMRLSLSDLALRIKIMKVNLGPSIEDVLSRALDPPSSINIQRAINMLVEVQALTPSEQITPMGRLLSKLPTDVHLGKFLLMATIFRCLDPALTIAAALNSKSPFVTPFGLEHEADRVRASFRLGNSDFLTLHNVFASWRRASENTGYAWKFCRVNYLSHQNLQQIEELRQQFLGYLIDTDFMQVDRQFSREFSRRDYFFQSRYSRGRATFISVPESVNVNSENIALVNAALVAGLYPKVLAVDSSNGQMRTVSSNQSVSFHPSSVSFGKRPTDLGVNYINYFTLMHSKKLYAWETGPVDDLALAILCGDSDFKLIADSVAVDRRIRFKVDPKTNVALKCLRDRVTSILAQIFGGRLLTESHVRWNDIATMVLGRMKVEGNEPETYAVLS